MTIQCLFIVFSEKNMLFFVKNHNIGDHNIKVHVCTKCDKSWCYILPKCMNNSLVDYCDDCGKNDTSPTLSLSPITTQCYPAI